MTWVAVAVIGGALISGGAAAASSRSASRASQRGADRATAESARQFDLIRGDTAGLRSTQSSALDQLARLYGWAPPSQAQFTADDGELVLSQGGVPAVDAQRYANDPAYKYAWDKTLAAERSNPLWQRQDQSTFYAKATDADWNRINETMARNLAEYRAQNPQAGAGAGSGRPDMGAFFESPDYQFNLGEVNKATDRSLAARGRALSGAGVKEGQRNAAGLASREYGSFVDRLLAAAGLGTTGTSISANAGMNHAGNVGAAQINAGNARASAYMTAGQGINNAVQGGISGFLLNQYLSKPPLATGSSGWSGPR